MPRSVSARCHWGTADLATVAVQTVAAKEAAMVVVTTVATWVGGVMAAVVMAVAVMVRRKSRVGLLVVASHS